MLCVCLIESLITRLSTRVVQGEEPVNDRSFTDKAFKSLMKRMLLWFYNKTVVVIVWVVHFEIVLGPVLIFLFVFIYYE